MLQKAQWMAHNGLHKEAVHALWINCSFKAAYGLHSDDATLIQKANEMARDWLNAVQWQDSRQGEKLKQAKEIGKELY